MIPSAVKVETVHPTLPIQEIKINEKEKLDQTVEDYKDLLASLKTLSIWEKIGRLIKPFLK